jgi:thiol-disulfide isomerase/thioredoxin
VACLLLGGSARASERIPVLEGAGALSAKLNELGRHSRTVVVHFFATWCTECAHEMPTMKRAAAAAEKAGAAVMFLSVDGPDDRVKKLPGFLHDFGIHVPTYGVTSPDARRITSLIDPGWTGSLPATFVLREGHLMKSFVGRIRDPADLANAVRASRATSVTIR